jgi:hypothetical protein
MSLPLIVNLAIAHRCGRKWGVYVSLDPPEEPSKGRGAG